MFARSPEELESDVIGNQPIEPHKKNLNAATSSLFHGRWFGG